MLWIKTQGYLQSTNADRMLPEAGSSSSLSIAVFFFCLVGFVLLLPIRILLFKEKDAFTDTIVTRDLLSE